MHTHRRLFAFALSLAAAVPVLAQPPKPAKDQPSPGEDPQLNSPSVDSALEEMRRRPPAAKPRGDAARPAITVPEPGGAQSTPAGSGPTELAIPGARRLREGAFVSRREGAILRAPSGDWIFVPAPSAPAPASPDAPNPKPVPPANDRPMVLMPCMALERLEQSAASAGERPRVSLSGQVFDYRSREYLLLSQPSVVLSAEAPEQPAEPPASSTNPPTDNPDVRDLIKDLESQRSAPRTLPKSGPPAQRAAGADKSALVSEGTMITARRGRLIRLSGGELAFSTDGDVNSQTDRPLVLLACQTLSRMEEVTAWRGENLVLEVSGRVLNYAGRNYLLPTMFLVPPPSDLGSL